jgi:hypothetical protein
MLYGMAPVDVLAIGEEMAASSCYPQEGQGKGHDEATIFSPIARASTIETVHTDLDGYSAGRWKTPF